MKPITLGWEFSTTKTQKQNHLPFIAELTQKQKLMRYVQQPWIISTLNLLSQIKLVSLSKSFSQTVSGHEHFTWEVACSRSWSVIGSSDSTKSPDGNRAKGVRPKSITTSINWWSAGCSLTLRRISSGKSAKSRPNSTSKSSPSGEAEHDELEEHRAPRKNVGYPDGILVRKWGKHVIGGDLWGKDWVLHWNLEEKAWIWIWVVSRGCG